MKEYKPLLWAAIGTLVVLSLFLLTLTKRASESAATTNTVSFSGQGKVVAKPDVAVIDMSILTEAPTSKAAQDQNSQKSKTLTDFLKTQNIEDKDVKTTGYNIYPQYYYPPYPATDVRGGQPRITGYQVSQTIQVKVHDLTKVDAVLDGVVTAGVNQVNGMQLTIDNPEQLKDQARQLAIEDAKQKARTLQGQLDIRLGRIINFLESGDGSVPVPMYYDKVMATGMGGGGGGPSVPAGENEINVSVTITYQIR